MWSECKNLNSQFFFFIHNVFHVPVDIINYQTGVEMLDAFIFKISKESSVIFSVWWQQTSEVNTQSLEGKIEV